MSVPVMSHRHEVRRELDAAEGEGERFGQPADEECLRETRDAHEEGVSAGKKADREFFDDGLLADDDLSELGFEFVVGLSQFIDSGDVVFGEGAVWGVHVGKVPV